MDHRLVFVGGLHRSGTTPLARTLASHPQVSGFSGGVAKEDEGQHLQTVYPPARVHGGAGRFAFAPSAHLTEHSPLATSDNAGRLFAQWAPHWDLSRPVLVEKSPPNVVQTRFLQALFPTALFVMIVRHPLVVTLATRKWRRSDRWATTLQHWFVAHDVLRADAPYLHRLHVLRYEDLVTEPETTLGALAEFLQLEVPLRTDGLTDHSNAYQRRWRWTRLLHGATASRYEARANEWGYTMRDPARTLPLPLPG